MNLSEIDHLMIEEVNYSLRQNAKPATVNRELAIVSDIFRMAVDYEEIKEKIRAEGSTPCLKIISAPGIYLLKRKIDCLPS